MRTSHVTHFQELGDKPIFEADLQSIYCGGLGDHHATVLNGDTFERFIVSKHVCRAWWSKYTRDGRFVLLRFA